MYVSDEKWVVFQEAYAWLVLENFKWFFRMTWRQVPSAPFFTQGINTKFDLIDEHVQKMMEFNRATNSKVWKRRWALTWICCRTEVACFP